MGNNISNKGRNEGNGRKYYRGMLRETLENEGNIGRLVVDTINALCISNLNKTNAISYPMENSIGMNYSGGVYEKNKLRHEDMGYIHMINSVIDPNLQERIDMKDNDMEKYDNFIDEYERYYNEIICGVYDNKTLKQHKDYSGQRLTSAKKSDSLMMDITSFHTPQDSGSFDNNNYTIRPESAKELNYTTFSNDNMTIKGIKGHKTINDDSSINMETISTSSNTLGKINNPMKIMKIGRKEEFTLSGSKEKNRQHFKGSPSHYETKTINLATTLPLKHDRTGKSGSNSNDYSINSGISNKKDIISGNQAKKTIPRQYDSVRQIQAPQLKLNGAGQKEKSQSPRQKYSLQIPLPKQKKSISPPQNQYMSINTNPFPLNNTNILPFSTIANTTISTNASSYTSLMKKKLKDIHNSSNSIELPKDKTITAKNNNTIGHTSYKSNVLMTAPSMPVNKGREEDYRNSEKSRSKSKSKMTFDLDLSDNDDNEKKIQIPNARITAKKEKSEENGSKQIQPKQPEPKVYIKPKNQQICQSQREAGSIAKIQCEVPWEQHEKAPEPQPYPQYYPRPQSQHETESPLLLSNNKQSLQQRASHQQESKITQQQLNPDTFIYTTSEKLKKLKELKNRQLEPKKVPSLKLPPSQPNKIEEITNLDPITEENRLRSRSKSQEHNSSSDRFSFRKHKPSTPDFEGNDHSNNHTLTSKSNEAIEQSPQSNEYNNDYSGAISTINNIKVICNDPIQFKLDFKVNSLIDKSQFDSIDFLI